MWKRAARAARLAGLAASLLGVAALDAGARSAPELLAPDASHARSPGRDTAARSRPVRVQHDSLAGLVPGAALRLGFFDDAAFVARLRVREARSPTRYTWHGDVEGMPGSSVLVSVVDGVVLANVWSPAGVYELRATPDGGALAREIDAHAFAPCALADGEGGEDGEGALGEAPGPFVPRSAAASASSCLEDGSRIDVLVVYTADARVGAGGTAAMEALVQMMETSTNVAYANSGIATRVRIVAAIEVAYTESGDSTTDRDRLTDPADGELDGVHALRDQLEADAVGLVVEDIESCGNAHFAIVAQNFPRPDRAFHVVARDCAVGSFSFAHELGHNQGSRHETDQALFPFPYSHGYNQGSLFRTIMATCCTPQRIQHFSNPDVLYLGLPTGTTSFSHNALSIDQTAMNVANFRCNAPDCGDGVDNDQDGLVDFPDDPGCDAADDEGERSDVLACDDGLDNDSDGLVDLADPGCASGLDPSEGGRRCGLGFELALLVALLARRHGRKEARSG